MFERLEQLNDRWLELNEAISQPDVIADFSRYQECLKERAALEPLIETWHRWQLNEQRLKEAEQLLSDPEMKAIAEEEIHALKPEQEQLLNDLKLLLVPPDPLDERNVYLEIRAGAGGEEAALFAGDLLRMYIRYLEAHRLTVKILSLSDSDLGGVNEALVYVSGDSPFGLLKYESGVHSVKRVPVTESSGRIHTSTATVAILPEAAETELIIDPSEIRVDVYHATGHGGQGVNTTDSAVRMTHLPTGLVVTCQDERSQLENKAKALKVLRSRLLDRMRSEQENAVSEDRRSQIGSGDRSEKIRTYYFNHDYVTDHRIGLTVNRVDAIMNGALDPFLEVLRLADRTLKLQSVKEG